MKSASFFGYRVLPTSFLTLFVYVGLFVALVITDALSDPPTPPTEGLDLKQAYHDLRHITAHPHPYNSHANDRVRYYILERLQSITQGYNFVHVANDTRSNGSWASGKYGVYFEGSNILVKIEGTSPSSIGGVLFSAHFDSVSTAPGATDDGMGVATLLQLVSYFSSNRMPRTAVFNINNGEEDWLNGAHAFLEHPWSNLTDVFLNLEGAAAGGRPILFRATSTSSVKAFRNTKRVPHPHANVLSSDAFARGLIRSGTDFSVYTTPGPRSGMDGLDLAFYKGRSRYHTKYDAVPFVLGGEKSLWSMMETARGVGENLLSSTDENVDHENDDDVPVYFDLFKSVVLVFPISGMLTFNMVALIVGPISLMFLLFCDFFLHSAKQRETFRSEHIPVPPYLRNQPSQPQAESRQGAPHRYMHHVRPPPSALEDEEIRQTSGPVTSCLGAFWRHIKFWVALIIMLVFNVLLAWGYVLFNPFAIHSLPYTVLFAFLSLSYLVLTFVLTLPSSPPFHYSKCWFHSSPAGVRPAQQQKYTIFVNLYIFTWILLALSTIGITKLHPVVGGGYLFSVWNICVTAACILVAVEGITFTALDYESPRVAEQSGRQLDDHLESNPLHPNYSPRQNADSDERTPLLSGGSAAAAYGDTSLLPSSQDISGGEGGGAGTLSTWWWIPQLLLSVPLPVTLFAHVAMVVLDGMAQTLSDGTSPWIVYIFTAILAAALILPLAPFSYKLRPFRPMTFLVGLVFILSTAYTWLVFPFTPQDPLKIYFQQIVVLPTLSTSNFVNDSLLNHPKLITVLSGPERYLQSSLIPSLPSAHNHGKVVTCSSDPRKVGLTRCEWESGPHMRPTPGSEGNIDLLQMSHANWKEGEFLRADVSRTGHSTARIRVKGKNTRSCRLYFDSRPIFKYDVFMPDTNRSSVKGMQKGYEVSPSGVEEVRLWSRTWEDEFVVDVDWSNSTGAISTKDAGDLAGRIACEWNEYESATVDNGSFGKPGGQRLGAKAKMPALEEVLNFLPDWAVVSKAADGLVEAWAPFWL